MQPVRPLPEHRFATYKPPKLEAELLGICPCGCQESVTNDYVYVEWDGEYFVDRDHLMKFIGAVERG